VSRGKVAILDILGEAHGPALEETHQALGDLTARVRADALLEVMAFLRNEAALDFDMLMDLTVVDHHPAVPRFEMVYHLYSLGQSHRLRIKSHPGDEAPQVSSLTGLWASANWMEREAFDLYGVQFEGHPDLRRILLYDEFEGHPLRKDYPKTRRQPLIGPQDA